MIVAPQPGQLSGTLWRAGRSRPGLVPEQLLAFKHYPYGEDNQRERADSNRHVHQQQAASDRAPDENPDRGND